jgi:hypothetical protein
MSKPQPLNCPFICGVQKELHISNKETEDVVSAQYNKCMSQCIPNQTNSKTEWPCLLVSKDLTPSNFNARVNQCQSQIS